MKPKISISNNYFHFIKRNKADGSAKTMVQRHKAIKCAIMNLHTKYLPKTGKKPKRLEQNWVISQKFGKSPPKLRKRIEKNIIDKKEYE